MKKPPLFVEKLPIPNREATEAALLRANSSKWVNYGPFVVLFIGTVAILALFSSDPDGHAYLPWLVFLATVGVIALLLFNSFKKLMRVEGLDACYATYQQDPIHQQYEFEIHCYYECLYEMKMLRLELVHLTAAARRNLRYERWIAHITALDPKTSPYKPRHAAYGERLVKHGFFSSYVRYEQTLRLAALYPKWLNLAEVRTFLAMHRQFRRTFHFEPNAEELAKETMAIADIFTRREPLLLKEMEERYANVLALRKQRYVAYLRFQHSYLLLTRSIREQLTTFKWKEC